MKIWILTTTITDEPECTGATPYLSRAAAEEASRKILEETSDVENEIHEHDIGVSIEDLKLVLKVADTFVDGMGEGEAKTIAAIERLKAFIKEASL